MKSLVIILSLQWGMWGSPTPNTQVSLHQPMGYQQSVVRLNHGKGSSWAKPGKWCGWYMRKLKNEPHLKYNLARNWATWGSPTSPRVGAVVVWRHHVGVIAGRNQKGQWLILSGNDGGKVKTRPWNLSKVIAYRI